MGKTSHLNIIQKGPTKIQEWIEKNPGKRLDISNMELTGIDFTKISFKYINCDGAWFSDCIFHKTNFNKVHLTNVNFPSEFNEAQFKYTAFNNVVFYRSINKCNFKNSIIYGRFMNNIIECDFTKAKFILSIFHSGKIENCNFKNASLGLSNFNTNFLENNDFLNCEVASCGFDNCNFNNCKNLATIKYDRPSSISFDTISNTFSNTNSFSPEFKTFVEKSGIPEEIFVEIPKILRRRKYYSTFISYGSPDYKFAEKLYTCLINEGVSTWFYPLNKTVGKRIWHEITEKRLTADRMIIVCSVGSLVRDGVKKEVEEQIDENPEKLIPISLDSTWKEEGFEIRRGSRNLKPWLIDRNYANFEKQEDFDKELKKLFEALKVN